tara:strand:+ start:252 stop:1352 length:1101 start_codon:yes stop_codon:yes gene_type:complete
MFRSYQKIDRRLTRVVKVGNVLIGGNNPISVQTMTNTLTKDIKKTTNQILKVVKAGADLVRVSIPDKESADALKIISKKSPIPIIADIHFHYKRALEAAENGASCLRINPGNIGSNDKVKEVIKAAKNNDCSIRIGVNGGSLEKQILEKYSEPNPDALVESAVLNMKMLEDNDFNNFKISVKSSDIFMSIKAYEKLSSICDYPLHLGITEAGSKRTGSIKSSIGIGNLLLRGIGDTIRISLSDEPEEEVKVGFEILKSLGLRQRGINIISCPSCARQQFPVIETVKKLEKALEDVTNPLTVSIIGCVVNGPGEATMTQIGITGGGNNTHMIYIDGKKNHIVKNTELIPYLEKIIREKVKLNHTKDH